MNRLIKKLASTVLVSAMVLTQPGIAFGAVKDANVNVAIEEANVETVDVADASVEKAEPASVVIEDAAQAETVTTTVEENGKESNEEVCETVTEETAIVSEDSDGETTDISTLSYADGKYTVYYPNVITIESDEVENPKITLSDSDELSDSADISLKFYGDESPEAMEKITSPSEVIWEPQNSNIIEIDDGTDHEEEGAVNTNTTATITAKYRELADGTEELVTGTQTVYAKVIYDSPFERKVFKSKPIRVTVAKPSPITKVAITENDKIVTKLDMVYGGVDGEDEKKLSYKVVAPASYYGFDDGEEWTTNSPYVEVSDGVVTLTEECGNVFKNTTKKSVTAKVTFTGAYESVRKKVSSTVSITIKKADTDPVIDKTNFIINKYNSYKGSSEGYSADVFRLAPKYGKAIDESNIEVYDAKNGHLKEFEVVPNEDTEDEYDYYLVLKDEFRNDFKYATSIKAKLLVPFEDGSTPKVYNVNIKVAMDLPRASLVQNGNIGLFGIDGIKGDYSIAVASTDIESIQTVFTDSYNRVLCDDDGAPIVPDEKNPSYVAEYPAKRVSDKAKNDFYDYNAVFFYPYEYFRPEYTELDTTDPRTKEDDKYNKAGYDQITKELNNFKLIKNMKVLVTFKGKFDGEETGEMIMPGDISNPLWKYKYKLLDVKVDARVKKPAPITYKFECTPDMIERHEIPDGANIRYEYVLNENAIVYDGKGIYEPETATYVTSDPYLRYEEGMDHLECELDPITKVTKVPVIWNFGSLPKSATRTITLRIENRRWSMPLDVVHTLRMTPEDKLPKTRFSTTTITLRNDGSDTAEIAIAGPNGINLDGYTEPIGLYKNYTDDDIADNNEPIYFFNPCKADELTKKKSDLGAFNSRVYATVNTIDPITGKARKLKPGTYKYTFGGFVINDQGDGPGDNDMLQYFEVNTVNVVVIDSDKKEVTDRLTSVGGINTVNRYDDKDNFIRVGSALRLKAFTTNSARAYMDNPADAIIKEVKWVGRTVSGNYINQKIDYEAPEPYVDPEAEEKEITFDSYNSFEGGKKLEKDEEPVGAYGDYYKRVNGSSDYPFFASFDKETGRIVLTANSGFPLRTDCTYSVKLGLCLRDKYCQVTHDGEDGFAYNNTYAEDDNFAQFAADYKEYTFTFKVKEEIPNLLFNKVRVPLYNATPKYAQKVELNDVTNTVHKYIQNIEVDSVVGPSLLKTVDKEVSKQYVNVAFKPATLFYLKNPNAQPNPDDYKNILTINLDEDKAKELLPGAYVVTFNVYCEDKAENTLPKKMSLVLDVK